MITIGLDLSLASTGMAIKRDANVELQTIKTKPDTCENDLLRLRHITNIIVGHIPPDVNLICVEDFFTPHGKSVGSAIKLAMLGTVVRMALLESKRSFILVAPTSLKKWITGKGNAEKSLILRDVYKKLGITAGNDNEADAAVLAHIAEQLILALKGESLANLPTHQREVITAILENKTERGYNLPA